jgi:hypothetical protein
MRSITFATIAGLMLLGTMTLAQSVSYDFDRSTNFSRFNTYAWGRGTELADRLNHQRVVRSIEHQLALKGLVKTATLAHADILVSYHASFDRNLRIDAYSSNWGGPLAGRMRSGAARTQQVVSGTLVVDITDASSTNIVWRGVASSELNPTASPDKRDKNISKTAQKLFKNYPPKP